MAEITPNKSKNNIRNLIITVLVGTIIIALTSDTERLAGRTAFTKFLYDNIQYSTTRTYTCDDSEKIQQEYKAELASYEARKRDEMEKCESENESKQIKFPCRESVQTQLSKPRPPAPYTADVNIEEIKVLGMRIFKVVEDDKDLYKSRSDCKLQEK